MWEEELWTKTRTRALKASRHLWGSAALLEPFLRSGAELLPKDHSIYEGDSQEWGSGPTPASDADLSPDQ